MGWRYKAGLALIGIVVLIWVTSAEVTQRIFKEYTQPFALTYLGASLMVIYLPIAIFKDWICSLLDKNLLKILYNDSPFLSSSIGLNMPLRINDMHYIPEDDVKKFLITDVDFNQAEEGRSLTCKNKENETQMLTESSELSSWDIAKCSFYLAPIWFVTEYLSNSALANTSVASTTVFTSTSGLFTLFFGALLGQDSINTVKIISVCISMTGVVMTTLGKTWAPDEVLSVSDAVLLKKSAGLEGDKVDVQKFFGYIGLLLFLDSGGLIRY